MQRPQSYRRNNIFIFVVIVLITIGTIVSTHDKSKKQLEPLRSGIDLFIEQNKSLHTVPIQFICDANSYQNNILEKLLKNNFKIESILIPYDTVLYQTFTHLYPKKDIVFAETERAIASSLNTNLSVFYDMQHIGLRNERYNRLLTTILNTLHKSKTTLYILDRPNSFGLNTVQGNFPNLLKLSTSPILNTPLFHGLSVGETAELIKETQFLDVDIQSILIQSYYRSHHPAIHDYHFETMGYEKVPFYARSRHLITQYIELFPEFRVQQENVYSSIITLEFTESIKIDGISLIYYESEHPFIKLKIDAQNFSEYFQFLYRFTSLIFQRKKEWFTPELEQRIHNFIGTHAFISAIKEGDTWNSYSTRLNEEEQQFLTARQSFLLY